MAGTSSGIGDVQLNLKLGCIDNNGIPSKITDAEWLYAENPRNKSDVNYDKLGKWMLFLDCKKLNENGLTKLDLAWPFIAKLVMDGHLLDAKASTAFTQNDKDDGVICCYTDNFQDKERVKHAAERIREVVDYQSPMYYKTDKATSRGIYRKNGNTAVSIYRYMPDGAFYERNESSQWRSNGNGNEDDDDDETFCYDRNGVPSEIQHADWLFFRRSSNDGICFDKSGKWMLFFDPEVKNKNDFTKLDLAWFSVVKLVEDGHLISAKASTAIHGEGHGGLICCYTSNYLDKENVRLVAITIRKFIDYPKVMFYKTDNASNRGIYRKYGHFAISLYRHFPNGELYERSDYEEWQLI